MSYRMWSVGCPCCSGCSLTIKPSYCAGSLEVWGNFYPPEIMPPTGSLLYYMANPSDIQVPKSEIFAPLADPTKSGIHTFKYPLNSDYCLVVQYDLDYIAYTGYIMNNLSCNENTYYPIPPLKDYITEFPCYRKTLQAGGTWTYTYTRPAQYIALNSQQGPVDLYHASGGAQHDCYNANCLPSGMIFDSGPYPATEYYQVYTNQQSVTFQITKNSPSPSYNPNEFVSDAKLLFSYVVKYPGGATTGLCGPTSNVYLYGVPQPSSVNTAYAYWGYAIVIDISAPANRCNFQPGGLYAFNINNPQSFVGDNAFYEADQFVNSLPQSYKVSADYLSTWPMYDLDSFGIHQPDDDDIQLDTSGPSSVYNCNSYTSYQGYTVFDHCDGSVLFDGYNSFSQSWTK